MKAAPIQHRYKTRCCLSVGLLRLRSSSLSVWLLWLRSSRVGNEKGSVVGDEGLLELVLRLLVNVFLVVGDDGLGDGLSEGIHLRDVTTSSDPASDVNSGELVESQDEYRLVNLQTEDLWL